MEKILNIFNNKLIGKIVLIIIMLMLKLSNGIRFVINREECFSYKVDHEGDIIHISFVVINSDTPWHNENVASVDLLINGPGGRQVHAMREKTSEKFELVAQKKGVYKFCFENKSPYHETIDFDVHAGHYVSRDHAKDEHLGPVYELIMKLEEALYNIQFEQHWLQAETDRQAIINEGMSKRAIHKAVFESVALIGASVIQVYLLKRLFDRKLGTSRV